MHKRYITLLMLLFVCANAVTLRAEDTVMDRAADYCRGDNDEGLLWYKPTYIMGQWGTPDPTDGETSYIKFQFSIRQQLCSNLYFGYTQKSFWSVSRDSAPFKDSNYDPELFWLFKSDDNNGFKLGQAGFEHESNGRDIGSSRSWNRIYWEPRFVYGPLVVSLKGWLPIKGWSTEGWRQNADLGDNPDILEYYGHGELAAVLKEGRWQFGVRGRKGAKWSYGNVQGDILYNLRKNLSLYGQVWDGYGESLLDYDKSSTRYGVGLIFTGLMP